MSRKSTYKLNKIITMLLCLITVLGCLALTGCGKDEQETDIRDSMAYRTALAQEKVEQGPRNILQRGWDFITGKGAQKRNEQEVAALQAVLDQENEKQAKTFEIVKYAIIGVCAILVIFIVLRSLTKMSQARALAKASSGKSAPEQVVVQAPAPAPQPQSSSSMDSPRF